MIVDTACVTHTSFHISRMLVRVIPSFRAVAWRKVAGSTGRTNGVVNDVRVDFTTTTTTIRTEDHNTQHYERARSEGHGETHITVSLRFGGCLQLRSDVRYSGAGGAAVSK